jgi:hypothetical protein
MTIRAQQTLNLLGLQPVAETRAAPLLRFPPIPEAEGSERSEHSFKA